MKTIAIIDDDIYIGDMLTEVLQREGYGVLRAYSGTEALLLLGQKKPDLVLLDLMLPGLSGEEVLSRIKGVPVIVLSARAGVSDKVDLLMGGAVDYVTKPFEIKELLARISAHLRTAAACGAEYAGALVFDDLCLDTSGRSVTAGGRDVKLTRTEYAILKILMQNPRQAVEKSVILDRISGDTPDCTETSLKMHVSNLRRKLREAGGRDYIEAVWGIGFKMQEAAKQSE